MLGRVSDYRLRLFLSVDLAGSTAFKAGAGRGPADHASPHPLWIVATRKFYEVFPSVLEKHYHRRKSQKNFLSEVISAPQSWKTIGDEIIFCCRIINADHLHTCVLSFVDALKEYGSILAADRHQLDVKGTAWIAAFPAVNMTATRSRLKKFDYLQEDFESGADKHPNEFDFLGPEFDAGFRIAKHSSPDKCAISLQLAWLLTRNPGSHWHPKSFLYAGRDYLKGVISDQPYPVVCLITERNESRAELREKESRITGRVDYSLYELHSFISHFMESESLEFPALSETDHPPLSYRKFQDQAGIELKAIMEQDIQLSESGDAKDSASDKTVMPTAITDAARVYRHTQADDSVRNDQESDNNDI